LSRSFSLARKVIDCSLGFGNSFEVFEPLLAGRGILALVEREVGVHVGVVWVNVVRCLLAVSRNGERGVMLMVVGVRVRLIVGMGA
jgi:hypothetical protein